MASTILGNRMFSRRLEISFELYTAHDWNFIVHFYLFVFPFGMSLGGGHEIVFPEWVPLLSVTMILLLIVSHRDHLMY